jgi:hypothetical protein
MLPESNNHYVQLFVYGRKEGIIYPSGFIAHSSGYHHPFRGSPVLLLSYVLICDCREDSLGILLYQRSPKGNVAWLRQGTVQFYCTEMGKASMKLITIQLARVNSQAKMFRNSVHIFFFLILCVSMFWNRKCFQSKFNNSIQKSLGTGS